MKSDIYKTLVTFSEKHGYAEVEAACKRFLREGRRVGITPTKRTSISRSLVKKLWIKQGGVCARKNHAVELKDATADHFESLNQGGLDKPSNLRMVCKPCNSSKRDNTPMRESKKTGRTIKEALPR